MKSKFIFWILLLSSFEVFSTDGKSSIPFKTNSTPVGEVASVFPYYFIVLILVLVLVIFLLKKYGFLARDARGADKKTVTVLEVRRITPNTFYFNVQVEGKEYSYLESKCHLKEIRSE